MKLDPERDLSITRLINAPRRLVWRAWSEPEHFQKWWCPRPWRTEIKGFELRPGGAFDTLLVGPDGDSNHVDGAFLEVVPAEKIVFTTCLAAGYRPLPATFLPMTAIIEMKDEGEGTRYTASALHQSVESRKKHLDMGFEEGWGVVIEQLGEVARALG